MYVGNTSNVGNVGNIGNVGNVGNTGNVGNVHNIGNVGNVGNIGNVGNVGNTGNVGNVGTISNVGNARYSSRPSLLTRLTHHASRNFVCNSRVGLMQLEEHCSRAIIDELKILTSKSCRVVYSRVITYE